MSGSLYERAKNHLSCQVVATSTHLPAVVLSKETCPAAWVSIAVSISPHSTKRHYKEGSPRYES
ncbi:hypothetical protein E2C01_055334 [Portunus trituberculatus]|uniref:Uncharacterized protein n=1 Tax=Portunus trituberculatus TaxID=210409 RepID=A0A5B7GV01_PORTR|nr:hypothetical protein [Portunus trituberculatus]